MCALADWPTGPNRLNFYKETRGYPGGKIVFFCILISTGNAGHQLKNNLIHSAVEQRDYL